MFHHSLMIQLIMTKTSNEVLVMRSDWDLFLFPYKLALDELKVKLKGQREMYRLRGEASPIEFVTGRLKPVESIIQKSKIRKIAMENLEEEMEDIAGLRIMCPFVEDVQEVVELMRKREDLEIIYEKDYISHIKESGYRSYHLVCKYPVDVIDQKYEVLVEIQVRTLAMNFWASIEHSLNYKYKGDYPIELKRRLQKTAKAVYQLDEEMSSIRNEIMDISEQEQDH